ncbi:hypothetical protein R3P38DRAFT_3196498 [Favolaschia claudopus]|uniref:Uncharacterized protein n=1 Tax=Favolaschia claudopus TaxID=2862362 RepID=A0AAW0B7V3_9AGAR
MVFSTDLARRRRPGHLVIWTTSPPTCLVTCAAPHPCPLTARMKVLQPMPSPCTLPHPRSLRCAVPLTHSAPSFGAISYAPALCSRTPLPADIDIHQALEPVRPADGQPDPGKRVRCLQALPPPRAYLDSKYIRGHGASPSAFASLSLSRSRAFANNFPPASHRRLLRSPNIDTDSNPRSPHHPPPPSPIKPQLTLLLSDTLTNPCSKNSIFADARDNEAGGLRE